MTHQEPTFRYTEPELHKVLLVAIRRSYAMALAGHSLADAERCIIDAFVSVTQVEVDA